MTKSNVLSLFFFVGAEIVNHIEPYCSTVDSQALSYGLIYIRQTVLHDSGTFYVPYRYLSAKRGN